MNEETEQSEDLEQVEIIEEATEEVDVESEQTEETPEEKPSRTQNAKQRLRRKLREAEARNTEYQERLDALESKLDGVINPPKQRPNRVDFDTEEEYEDSLFEWRDTKAQSTPKPEPKPTPTLDVAPDVRKHWLNQIDEAADKYEDFEDVLFSIPKESMTDPMTLAIMESDHGGDIAYFLGNNPKEAERISKLTIPKQVIEIDKLGNKFNKPTTSAPDPIKPPKGTDSPVKDLEKMSPEEYRDYRRKRMAL